MKWLVLALCISAVISATFAAPQFGGGFGGGGGGGGGGFGGGFGRKKREALAEPQFGGGFGGGFGFGGGAGGGFGGGGGGGFGGGFGRKKRAFVDLVLEVVEDFEAYGQTHQVKYKILPDENGIYYSFETVPAAAPGPGPQTPEFLEHIENIHRQIKQFGCDIGCGDGGEGSGTIEFAIYGKKAHVSYTISPSGLSYSFEIDQSAGFVIPDPDDIKRNNIDDINRQIDQLSSILNLDLSKYRE